MYVSCCFIDFCLGVEKKEKEKFPFYFLIYLELCNFLYVEEVGVMWTFFPEYLLLWLWNWVNTKKLHY